jgi:hypothetical protein
MGPGIVFVLIPGGEFLMGAQKEDKEAPNYDPQAMSRVATAQGGASAVFLGAARADARAVGTALGLGEEARPSRYKAGELQIQGRLTDCNPVEQVSWEMCRKLLTHWGLEFPTERSGSMGVERGRPGRGGRERSEGRCGGGESSGSNGGGGGDLDGTSGTGLSWRMATCCTRLWMRCARMRGGSITCTGICGSGAGTCMEELRLSREPRRRLPLRRPLRARVDPQQPRRRLRLPFLGVRPSRLISY